MPTPRWWWLWRKPDEERDRKMMLIEICRSSFSFCLRADIDKVVISNHLAPKLSKERRPDWYLLPIEDQYCLLRVILLFLLLVHVHRLRCDEIRRGERRRPECLTYQSRCLFLLWLCLNSLNCKREAIVTQCGWFWCKWKSLESSGISSWQRQTSAGVTQNTRQPAEDNYDALAVAATNADYYYYSVCLMQPKVTPEWAPTVWRLSWRTSVVARPPEHLAANQSCVSIKREQPDVGLFFFLLLTFLVGDMRFDRRHRHTGTLLAAAAAVMIWNLLIQASGMRLIFVSRSPVRLCERRLRFPSLWRREKWIQYLISLAVWSTWSKWCRYYRKHTTSVAGPHCVYLHLNRYIRRLRGQSFSQSFFCLSAGLEANNYLDASGNCSVRSRSSREVPRRRRRRRRGRKQTKRKPTALKSKYGRSSCLMFPRVPFACLRWGFSLCVAQVHQIGSNHTGFPSLIIMTLAIQDD